MNDELHVPASILSAGLGAIEQSPKAASVLDMIVRRPGVDLRECVAEARLDEAEGLIGDDWRARGSTQTPDKTAHPEMQLTVMNARAIALIAASRDRWALAGDQLFVDLDLSATNLPAGSRLQIGEAVIEISTLPHLGCAKFKARFGMDALQFVNSPAGRELRLRGVNARVITGGAIRVGDRVVKLSPSATAGLQ